MKRRTIADKLIDSSSRDTNVEDVLGIFFYILAEKMDAKFILSSSSAKFILTILSNHSSISIDV